MPRWSTIVLFVAMATQFIVSWVRAKRANKTGKGLRQTVLPGALMGGAASVSLGREFFADLPVWLEATLAIFCFVLILIALALLLIQLKRYLRQSWQLEHNTNK